MVIMIVFLSGIAAMISALVALIGFDVSWSQMLVIYLVAASLPAALIMATTYLHMLIKGAFGAPESSVEVQRIR